MTNTKVMKRVAAAVAGIFVVAITVAASKPGNVTATATIFNGTPSYPLESDGSISASYSGDFTPTGSTAGTDYFQLNLELSKTRSVYLTLNPLDNNSAAAAPFQGPVSLPGAIIYSRCFTPTGYQDWTQIHPTTPDGNCALRVNFTYGHESYTLVMSPEFPGTGTAIVTCTKWSPSSNSCVAWTDVPNSSTTYANVAYLYNTTSGPATSGEVLVGSYSMTFSISVTNP